MVKGNPLCRSAVVIGAGGAIWGVLLVPACFHPIYDHPACGPNGECPGGLTCNAQLVCEREGEGEGSIPQGGVSGAWMFDTAADFGAPGHAVQDMTIEGRGALTPNAYTYGGLVAHGLQGVTLWQHGDTSWTKLDTVTPSGAGLWRGESLASGDPLAYLGITDKSRISVWFEGEVWLEAGSNETFKLTGNDVAFFQLAPPGTAMYSPVSDNNNVAVSVPTPETGWYPIRIGFADGDASSSFNFTHGDSGTAQTPWTRERLRARTSELDGMLRTVFGRQIFGGGQGSAPPVTDLEASDLLPQTDFGTPPQGAGTDDWSARYLGQIYIAQPGSYMLRITSDDGNRGRLGAAHGEANWARDSGNANVITAVPATLAAGWNDVTVDYNQVSGGKKLHVQLDGPDFANIEVPRDQLRPVEPADDRLVFGGDAASHAVVDGGGAGAAGTATMPVAGYPGETVTAIDLTYEISSPHWAQLKVDLETPAGPSSRLTIRDQDDGLGDGDHIAQLTIPVGLTTGRGALLGGPANGTWKLYVYDVAPLGGDSALTCAKLTLHTTGGPDKVARMASWTSPVLDGQTNVFAIDGVTWDERLPAGATLAVFVRACRRADCSDGTWPVAPVMKAAPFAVGAARYLQLRVDMTSDGTLEPELRSLAVTYRRGPG